jgi:hypothetical protein
VIQEGKPVWAQVATRRSVEQAAAQHTSAKELAAALDVHFLIRGNVKPSTTGYDVELLAVDGATERVIFTRSVAVPNGQITPRTREDVAGALGWLTYKSLEVEVQRVRSKPVEQLDVRDLSYRAYVDWNDGKEQRDEKGAYMSATDLLNRALALAPDDPLALFLTARVNLCDCVDGWSKNIEVQQDIGSKALEKYLRHDPESPAMLDLKSELLALRGRYEESMLIADAMLKRNPESAEALANKAYALLKLGRPQEALPAVNEVIERMGRDEVSAMAAAIHYELAQYELAAKMAQRAITKMDREDLKNPRSGAVGLTLVAAEARLGHLARAKAALADFNAAVPDVKTIAAMKKWIHPGAFLAGYEPLFDGLRLAGVPD